MFYLISTFILVVGFYLGFEFGFKWAVEYIINIFNLKGPYGLETFSIGLAGFIAGVFFGLFGTLVAIIILHKLSKKYFVGVRFGRTILLSLLTTFLLLFLYLLFWPK